MTTLDDSDFRRLLKLAGSISDRAPVDWEGADSNEMGEDTRAMLKELRALEGIARVHASGPVSRSGNAAGLEGTPARKRPEPEKTIGSWGHLQLIESIGKGSFGEVFRAWDPGLDREVALKLFRPTRLEDGDPAELVEEGRLLARVRHPNVIRVHGADCFEARVGFWMEFVRGRTLQEIVREQGPFGAREAILIGMDLCSALASVHRIGLIHQDIKAANVTREEGGRIVLLDFGSARDLAHEGPGVSGTPIYMAPENLRGRSPTVASDIYSAGVLLYYLVTGTYPVAGASLENLIEAHEREEFRLLRDERPGLPAAFVNVVERALSREPDRRHGSAGQMEQALASALGREPETSLPMRSGDSDSTPRLMVLMATEIVDAVGLMTRHGNSAYQQLLARHDEIRTQVVEQASGNVVDDTERGFLASFHSATDAVTAALRLQQVIAAEPWNPAPLRVRIGIHIGEVTDVQTSGERKLVGLAMDVVHQLAELALAGQVLMTRTVFEDARQFVRGHPKAEEEEAPSLKWMAHGAYLFKETDVPVNVFEVGGDGFAPLRPPQSSAGVRRAVAGDDEITLGWRPATGMGIPDRPGWVLKQKLGAGTFGEAWMAVHGKTQDKRTFKFCFDADRLRSFKRELTLFRLMRESLGERPDIARVFEVQVEKAPFYLESEFTRSGNLAVWAVDRGGFGEIPLSLRLDLVRRTAEAAAAAHSVGILHKDIKPSNILIYEETDGAPRPRLADFGIGALVDRERMKDAGITMTGFSESGLAVSALGTEGQSMYAPPESQIGAPFTLQGDVYALGVLLYQMVVGDLRRPLGPGWERDIDDDLLRQDIAACVDHDPSCRLADAASLAQRLGRLDERRRERRRRQHKERLRRVGIATLATVAAAAIATLVYTQWTLQSRARAETREARQELSAVQAEFEKTRAELSELRAGADGRRQEVEQARSDAAQSRSEALLGRAQEARAASRRMVDYLVGIFEQPYRGGPDTRNVARQLLEGGARRVQSDLSKEPLVQAEFMSTLGNVYSRLGETARARSLFEDALAIRQRELGENRPEVADSLDNLASLLYDSGNAGAAWPYHDRALEARARLLGPEHPRYPGSLWEHGRLRLAHGESEGAQQLFQEALTLLRQDLDPRDYAYIEARYYWLVQDRRLAVRRLEEAVALGYARADVEPGAGLAFLARDAEFDALLTQVREQALINTQ